MLAVDEDAVAAAHMLCDELDPSLEHLRASRLEVRGGQVQEVDPVLAKPAFIVAIFGAKVDDRSDPVRRRQLRGAPGRKASADRHMVREPVEIGLPFAVIDRKLSRFGRRRHHQGG